MPVRDARGRSDSVVAAVVDSRIEAQLVVGMLEANGIRARLSADDDGGQDLALDVTEGVRVFVETADLATARMLIEGASR